MNVTVVRVIVRVCVDHFWPVARHTRLIDKWTTPRSFPHKIYCAVHVYAREQHRNTRAGATTPTYTHGMVDFFLHAARAHTHTLSTLLPSVYVTASTARHHRSNARRCQGPATSGITVSFALFCIQTQQLSHFKHHARTRIPISRHERMTPGVVERRQQVTRANLVTSVH